MRFSDKIERQSEFRLRAMESAKNIITAMRVSLVASRDVHQRMDALDAYVGDIENAIFSRMEEAFELGRNHPDTLY